MKLPKLTLKTDFLGQIGNIRQQRFFSDQLSIIVLTLTLIVNGLNLVALALKLHPTSFDVPIHYSNLNNGFDELGKWYVNYRLGLFAVLVTVLNTVMAWHSFSRSRITSFFLLVGAFVVGLFCLIISLAFGALL